MPFSSGTFSLVAGNPVVTGTTISSTVQNNTMNDVATGLSTAVLKDGTQTITANIPFAGYKATQLLLDPHMGAYVFNDWNPSDCAATVTAPAGTTNASLTASYYITSAANSLGVLTVTFAKAGNYEITVLRRSNAAAAYTLINFQIGVGGTATRYLTQTAFAQASDMSGENFSNAITFALSATAAQTLTVSPTYAVTQGGGTASNYTASCSVLYRYTGS